MLKEHALQECLRVVVATKCDLVDTSPAISRSTAENLAAGLNRHLDLRSMTTLPYFETSSKTGRGVREVFEFVFQHCLANRSSDSLHVPDADSFMLSAESKSQQEKSRASRGKCCS